MSAESNSNDNPGNLQVLLSQYEQAIQLYQHEDNLNWSKVNHLLYSNAGLWAVMIFTLEKAGQITGLVLAPARVVGVVAIVGILVSIAFGLAIRSGVVYMNHRKSRVIEIEDLLIKLGGCPVVKPTSERAVHLKRSGTSLLLEWVPFGLAALWVAVMFVGIMCGRT